MEDSKADSGTTAALFRLHQLSRCHQRRLRLLGLKQDPLTVSLAPEQEPRHDAEGSQRPRRTDPKSRRTTEEICRPFKVFRLRRACPRPESSPRLGRLPIQLIALSCKRISALASRARACPGSFVRETTERARKGIRVRRVEPSENRFGKPIRYRGNQPKRATQDSAILPTGAKGTESCAGRAGHWRRRMRSIRGRCIASAGLRPKSLRGIFASRWKASGITTGSRDNFATKLLLPIRMSASS